jgi:UDP-N-acetylglucosamine 2-epimerase (non-hydrolysing)/GDP/UDP-N,N'-diacetylbacillosamine 2-epimerase (hydrolysing)
MEKLNICSVTGSRSEYGLLKYVLLEIKKYHNLILVVTGSHLSEKFGNTYQEIEKDFIINEKVYMNLDDDSSKNITSVMGKELSEFSNIFNKYKIDLLLVLGDRYEILIPVVCANIYKIPIAHMCGGDITEGAYDDNIRHAITKMSHIHFVTNDKSANIIAQMGENRCRIFNVGNSGLLELLYFVPQDNIIEQFNMNEINIIVIYHAVTLNSELVQNNELLNMLFALDVVQRKYGKKCNIYFIGSNADNDHNFINDTISNFCKSENRYQYKSLPRDVFLNLIYGSNILVGNSSCGIYEIPLMKKYTINIGDRQKGRLSCSSIINCTGTDKIEIINKIHEYLTKKFVDINDYPYDIKDTPKEIIKVINNLKPKELIKKQFMLLDKF